jgi:hypothetical protein
VLALMKRPELTRCTDDPLSADQHMDLAADA